MILCLGTTHAVQRTMIFPRLVLGEVNRAVETRDTAAGKALNAAKVIRTLEEPVLTSGFLGGDTGRLIVNDLERIGARTDFVWLDTPTRICVTVVDRSGAATELVEETQPAPGSKWQELLDALPRLFSQAEIAVLSGSLPPQAPQDFYATCVQLAAEKNVPVVLDARGKPLLEALPLRPFVAKPNRAELAETTGLPVETDDQLRAAVARLCQMGAQWAAVTLGAEGAIVSDGTRFWRLKVPKIDAVSAVGSGDAFAGGLAVGLLRGQGIPESCRLGAACGAANAMTPFSGHVDPAKVSELVGRIELESHAGK